MVRDQRIGQGLGVVDIDLRGGALADEIGVAAQVALRAFELRLVLGERALGLLDLRIDLAGSSVNSRSPSFTLAPSSKCTATMVVSSRDFSATLEIGVTMPMASTSTGTGLRSALASSTGNDAGTLRRLGAGIAAHPGRSGDKGGSGHNAQRASK